ncbi:MAG: hypothetical protein IPH20_14480 [Bacteroidales bacterium]|nr:hypothetical protein [Bacteroidales bacterium]
MDFRIAMVKVVKDDKRLNTYASSYLNLLPDDFLPEDNIEQGSANKYFNIGIKKAISTLAFIIDTRGIPRKCDEIILDETGLFTLLGERGINLFEQIVQSNKKLPLEVINQSIVNREYLNIEQYSPQLLIKQLELDINREFLASTIKILNLDVYFSFLSWLDSFIRVNEVSNNWVLDLPIIRLDNDVSSLNHFIGNSTFHIRIQKTKSIESILLNLGFGLSEFFLDEYSHIMAITNQGESYLNKDARLYERISQNSKLGTLNPSLKK